MHHQFGGLTTSFVDTDPGVSTGEVVVLCPTSSGCRGSTGSGPTLGGFENAPRAPLGLELVLNPATVFRKKSANKIGKRNSEPENQ